MKVLAFCSRKGGTGKTTLSYNTLERAAASGLKTAVVDFDPQRGSLNLLRLRSEAKRLPTWAGFGALVTAEGADQLHALREQGEHDLLVCDLPGFDSVALLRALREADLVVSPVGPAFMDLVSGRDLANDMAVGGVQAWFVGNNLPPYRAWEQGFQEDLSSMDLARCPVTLRRRALFMRSVLEGAGVCEAAPGSAAAREVDALWRWLAEKLELELPLAAALPEISGRPAGVAAAAGAGQGALAGLIGDAAAAEEE